MAATQILKIVIQVVDKATAGLKKVEKSTEAINKNMKKTNVNAFRFLGLGLGMLFTGMALKKFFGGFLRAAFNTFQMVIDAETQAFQKTQQLRAAWEFLKFSIIDALLSSDIIIALIDNIIGLIDLIGQLPEETRAKIGMMAVTAFIAAAAIMFLGQFMLLLIGISSALKMSLGYLIFSLLSLTFIWGVMKSDLSKVEKALLVIGIAFGIVAVQIWKANFALAFPILLLATLIFLVGLLSIKYGGLGNAMKAFGITALMVFAAIVDFIYGAVIGALQWLALGVLWLLKIAKIPIPAPLVQFVEFEPRGEVLEKVAVTLEKFGITYPEVVEEKPIGSIFEGVGEEMLSGFADFSEKMMEGINTQMETMIEKQSEKTDEQTQDIGGYIEDQTLKLDETMKNMGEFIVNGTGDLLQNQAVIVPTTQG